MVSAQSIQQAYLGILQGLQGASQRGEIGSLVALGITQLVGTHLSRCTGLTIDQLMGGPISEPQQSENKEYPCSVDG